MSTNPGPHGWKNDPTTTVSQERLLIVITDEKVSVSVSVGDEIKSTSVDRADGSIIPSDATS